MKRRLLDIPVGSLLVRHRRIIEPISGARVAYDFPTPKDAIAAANEMNEVADWLGVIKAIAEGHMPNCQDELKSIAQKHGGTFADSGRGEIEQVCAAAVARVESGS